jgi:hypothetical protein
MSLTVTARRNRTAAVATREEPRRLAQQAMNAGYDNIKAFLQLRILIEHGPGRAALRLARFPHFLEAIS